MLSAVSNVIPPPDGGPDVKTLLPLYEVEIGALT